MPLVRNALLMLISIVLTSWTVKWKKAGKKHVAAKGGRKKGRRLQPALEEKFCVAQAPSRHTPNESKKGEKRPRSRRHYGSGTLRLELIDLRCCMYCETVQRRGQKKSKATEKATSRVPSDGIFRTRVPEHRTHSPKASESYLCKSKNYWKKKP